MRRIVFALGALMIIAACNKTDPAQEIVYHFESNVEPVAGHGYVDETDDFLKEMADLESLVKSMSPESEKNVADKGNAIVAKYSGQYRRGSILVRKFSGLNRMDIVDAKILPLEVMYLYNNSITGPDSAAFAEAFKAFVKNADAQPFVEDRQDMIRKVEDELISKFSPDRLSGSFTLSLTLDHGISGFLIKEWTYDSPITPSK